MTHSRATTRAGQQPLSRLVSAVLLLSLWPASHAGATKKTGTPPCNVANCFVSPCAVHECPAGLTCVENYCGGCFHRWDFGAAVELAQAGSLLGAGPSFTPAPPDPRCTRSCVGSPPPTAKQQSPARRPPPPTARRPPPPPARRPPPPKAKPSPPARRRPSPPARRPPPPNARPSPPPRKATPRRPPPARTGGVCPDGSAPVQCAFAPCMAARCSAGHTCVNDYCGGCRAVCTPDSRPPPPPPRAGG
jgi:outer membrane biosynthesis protein TonB